MSTEVEIQFCKSLAELSEGHMGLHSNVTDHLELLKMSDLGLSDIDIEDCMDHYSIDMAGNALQGAMREMRQRETP